MVKIRAIQKLTMGLVLTLLLLVSSVSLVLVLTGIHVRLRVAEKYL